MTEGIQALLALPIDTLALLAGGYLAYRLAYIGRDKTHSTIDVLFIVTAFAFVTSAARLAAANYFTGASFEPRRDRCVPSHRRKLASLWFQMDAEILTCDAGISV